MTFTLHAIPDELRARLKATMAPVSAAMMALAYWTTDWLRWQDLNLISAAPH